MYIMHFQMFRDFISSVGSEIIVFCQLSLTEELIAGAAACISGFS